MKTFFEKFKASMALDRERQSAGENQPVENSLRALDEKLRESRGVENVPSGLHGDIMRAVRTSVKESEPAPVAGLWPRIAVAAVVLAICVGAVWSLNRAPAKVTETAPAAEATSLVAAIEQGHALTQGAPEAALEPLSGELEKFNSDLRKAVDFVVASVP